MNDKVYTYLWKFQIDLLRFSKKGESEDGPFKVGFVPAHWNRLKIKENTIDRADGFGREVGGREYTGLWKPLSP